MTRPLLSKQQQLMVARTRISRLFAEADRIFSTSKARANRYVELARTIAMRVRLPLPLEYKQKYCGYCYSYLRYGANARVRTRSRRIIISCLECRKMKRIPLLQKSRAAALKKKEQQKP